MLYIFIHTYISISAYILYTRVGDVCGWFFGHIYEYIALYQLFRILAGELVAHMPRELNWIIFDLNILNSFIYIYEYILQLYIHTYLCIYCIIVIWNGTIHSGYILNIVEFKLSHQSRFYYFLFFIFMKMFFVEFKMVFKKKRHVVWLKC